MRVKKCNVRNIYLLTIILISGFFTSLSSQDQSQVLKSLAHGADVIVSGKVVNQESFWNEDRTRIFTNVTIQVEEYLKGNTGSGNVTVSHPGGEVGEVGELYSHTPSFANDEEVLVFIKKDTRDNKLKVYQGEYGKLSISRDEKTGEKLSPWKTGINSLKQEIRGYVLE